MGLCAKLKLSDGDAIDPKLRAIAAAMDRSRRGDGSISFKISGPFRALGLEPTADCGGSR